MQALGLRRLHHFLPQWLLALMITNQLGRLSGELNEDYTCLESRLWIGHHD